MSSNSDPRVAILGCCMFFMFLGKTMSSSSSLKVGFYKYTCPSAETIVRNVVTKAVSKDRGVAAGLIRMHFHDCFVRGCDASILLASTPTNIAERDHPANNPSLRGFDAIDEAKARIEAVCPRTVSCADIIAFAARDSTYRVGGINYSVPSGRRDGRISLIDEVTQNLPAPSLSAKELADNFARKKLSVEEMVTLSGAHSIGVSHCPSFSNRLYSFNGTHSQDPSLDPSYAAVLRARCPSSMIDGVAQGRSVVLETTTPDYLDNNYYKELTRRRGLRDCRISLIDEVTQNLPAPSLSAKELADNFARKKLSVEEMVTLSGAHSIGVSHCPSFSNRLYSFNGTHSQDPSLDPSYAAVLRARCPSSMIDGVAQGRSVVLETTTPDYLDNNYYKELTRRRGLLVSDQTLYDSLLTSQIVLNHARGRSSWRRKYGKAMVRMGSIDVLTGSKGEIRRWCSRMN